MHDHRKIRKKLPATDMTHRRPQTNYYADNKQNGQTVASGREHAEPALGRAGGRRCSLVRSDRQRPDRQTVRRRARACRRPLSARLVHWLGFPLPPRCRAVVLIRPHARLPQWSELRGFESVTGSGPITPHKSQRGVGLCRGRQTA